MRRRIGIYGATDETLQLIPLLSANPEVEIAGIFDPDAAAARERWASDPELGALVSEDPACLGDVGLHAVVDAGIGVSCDERFPHLARAGVQIVPPLTARLLWAYGPSSADRKAELLQALHEVVESYNLTIEADDLFRRVLEIAIGVTGADGGSLMLLDNEARELRVRVAGVDLRRAGETSDRTRWSTLRQLQ